MKYRNQVLKYVTGAGALVCSAASMADVSGAEAIFTGLTADATALNGYSWPVAAFVTGSLIVIGLAKRYARTSAR